MAVNYCCICFITLAPGIIRTLTTTDPYIFGKFEVFIQIFVVVQSLVKFPTSPNTFYEKNIFVFFHPSKLIEFPCC
jgi:hypothetical protein